jgi:hypothetical protein
VDRPPHLQEGTSPMSASLMDQMRVLMHAVDDTARVAAAGP